MQGHAIEVRLYTEDPYAGFAPQTGHQVALAPRGQPYSPVVRIDHGLTEGGVIGPYYDAMVAKLIAHGRDRADAIRQRLRAAQVAPLISCATTRASCAICSTMPSSAAAR